MRNQVLGIALGALLLFPALSDAAVIQTFGSGIAVSIVDRSANFNSLSEGTNLDGYTEGGLVISVQGTSYQGNCCANFPSNGPFPGAGFSGGFHYPSGGSSDPTHILASDDSDLIGIEFNVGSGWIGQSDAHIYWEAYDNSLLVGSGSFDVEKGTVLGFRDNAGFDELRIAALGQSGNAFEYQALALDNLVAQITPGDVIPRVPAPASLILLGIGLIGVGISRLHRP